MRDARRDTNSYQKRRKLFSLQESIANPQESTPAIKENPSPTNVKATPDKYNSNLSSSDSALQDLYKHNSGDLRALAKQELVIKKYQTSNSEPVPERHGEEIRNSRQSSFTNPVNTAKSTFHNR